MCGVGYSVAFWYALLARTSPVLPPTQGYPLPSPPPQPSYAARTQACLSPHPSSYCIPWTSCCLSLSLSYLQLFHIAVPYSWTQEFVVQSRWNILCSHPPSDIFLGATEQKSVFGMAVVNKHKATNSHFKRCWTNGRNIFHLQP